MRFILVFLLIIVCDCSFAQYTNSNWCFGDSAGINFNFPISTFSSGVRTKNGSASISDQQGKLLFYGSSYDDSTNSSGSLQSGIIKSRNHETMLNGTNLIGEWYHTMTIIPKSVIDSTFYVFTAGVIHDLGLYYSIVDLKQNSGLGEVIQKNIQLDNFPVYDGLTAIKHGNGKDWWLIYQRWDQIGSSLNNEFYVRKVDSTGIATSSIQSIGSLHDNSAGDLSFNSDGTKLVYAEWKGLVELYDFDRYTGMISNPVNIEPERLTNPFPYYISSVFSPNGRYLYLTSYQISYHKACCLYQYDLLAPDIFQSKTLIDSFPYPTAMNCMEMGQDKKIYICSMDENYSYPYPETVHNAITDNLSVINSPDSLGAACDFQPFSFYLGGGRCYVGLPNNPDYTMPALDTTVSVHEIVKNENTTDLKIFYHPQWDLAFINADKLKGKSYVLSLYDISGKIIFTEKGNLLPPYFTKDLSMQAFSKGVYVAVLQTEKELLKKKFVKF